MKKARFQIYSYFGIESCFKDVLVYVDVDKKHPDPSKLMLWGKAGDGSTISDFKRRFTTTGKSAVLEYPEAPTAMQEQKNKLNALYSHLGVSQDL